MNSKRNCMNQLQDSQPQFSDSAGIPCNPPLSNRSEHLISSIHNRLKILRNIETLIMNRDFRAVFDACSKEDQDKVDELVENYDLQGVKGWYKVKREEE